MEAARGIGRGMVYHLKDVRPQNVATNRFFLKLPRRKVMIYFCQKKQKKKKGGHRARFRDHEVHF